MKVISTLTLSLLFCISLTSQTIPIRETNPLPLGVLFFDAAQLPNGDVIAYGGGVPAANNETWHYDWETEVWTQIGDLAYPVAQAISVALSNGDILSIGGTDDFTGKEQRSQLFKVSTQTWEEEGAYGFLNPVYTRHSALTLPDDYVLMTTTNGDFTVYDPATGMWSDQDAPAPLDAGGSPMVWLEAQEEVLFTGAGGQIFEPGAPPTSGNLFYLNPAQPLYQDAVIRLLDGHVLTMDLELSFDNFVTNYNPVTRVATQVAEIPFNSGVNSRSAVLMPDGKVLTYGFGDLANLNDTKLIQVYDPATDEWEYGVYDDFGPSGAPRMFVLPDSSVLAISIVNENIDGSMQNRCWILNRDEGSSAFETGIVASARAFPSPSSGQVFFPDAGEGDLLKLYSPNGKLIGEWRLENREIDLSAASLPNGLYFFTLSSSDGPPVSSGKLVLVK
ncbi:MAG: hypothetical protein IPH04_04355 [Saprospirales bacterium]|nr:hypothetical protein [Saprospirales bacterium]